MSQSLTMVPSEEDVYLGFIEPESTDYVFCVHANIPALALRNVVTR